MAHISQSRPDSGRGFKVKVLEMVWVVPVRSEAEINSLKNLRQHFDEAGGVSGLSAVERIWHGLFTHSLNCSSRARLSCLT